MKLMLGINWSGCWERKFDRDICRWIVAWFNNGDQLNGCIAGYSGGGAFQLEKFSIHGVEIKTSDDWGFSNYLTSEEVTMIEDCQDFVLSLHIDELWTDNDTLVLLPEKAKEMDVENDLLVGGIGLPNELLPLFEKIGLISRPA